MIDRDLSHMALELPPADRLELARRLVESVVAPQPLSEAVREGSVALKTWRRDVSPA